MQAETLAVASFAGLITGCLQSAGGITPRQSDVSSVGADAGVQQDLSAQLLAPSPPGPSYLGIDHPAPAILSNEYWVAVADLDLAASRNAAHGDAEISFAEGIALFAAGDYAKAESVFTETSTQRNDLTVAVGSRSMLATTLLYEQKWAALRDLSTNPRLGLPDQQNLPGVEQWGKAFASLEAQSISFAQGPVLLPLKVTAVGTPTIQVRINGKDYAFWLDTGSSITMLSSNVAADAGISALTPDVLSVGTFAGIAPVKPAVLKRMELGPIVITNSPVIVMDASLMRVRAKGAGVPMAWIPVDGIIGWDVMRQFDTSLDYGRNRITLRRPDSLGTRGTAAQNLTWVGRPLVQVHTRLGGTLHFTLDTGAQSSFVNALIVEKLGAVTRNADARVFGIAESGGRDARVVPSLRLHVGGKSLLLKGLIVFAPRCSGLTNCDGILGSDIAQFGTIRIDATNGLFLIED